MVEVTRINGTKLNINPVLVETIEETPDTVIYFNSGRKIVVTERKKEIEEQFVRFLSLAIKEGIERSRDNSRG